MPLAGWLPVVTAATAILSITTLERCTGLTKKKVGKEKETDVRPAFIPCEEEDVQL